MALQSAYQAAAQANAGMGTGVQDAWEHAANTITGLAGTATGGVADALKADLATQEQALSRVGAGGTGFDALSQAAPEQYRSGIVPGEFDVRMGALGNTWLNQAAQSLNARGLQEGIAAEGTDRGKINSDLMKAVSDLTAGRSDYETKLREQLLGARSDQIKAIQDQQQFDASLAVKKVQIEQAQQKIDNQFQISLASAQTAADRAAVYRWKAQQDSVLSAARNSIAQQNADAHMISANASATRAVNATKPGGGKPPSASSVSTTVARANKAGTDAFTKEMTRLLAKQPGAHAPKGTSQKDWALQPEFQAAKAAAAHEASIHDFGNLMYRVIESMNDHLRPLGWNAHQIKKAAYELISATIPAPPAWLQANPGYGPKA
jgi:hypothetical protein